MGNNASTVPRRRSIHRETYHKPQTTHKEYTGIVPTGIKSRAVTEVEARDVEIAPGSGGAVNDARSTTVVSMSNSGTTTPATPRPTVVTPSILTDEFISGDYFSRHDEQVVSSEVVYDEDEDGYGIDEDLADPSVDDEITRRQVKLKYVDGSRNMVLSDQVYVVGSFDQWAKKVALSPDFDVSGKLLFKAVLELPMGIYRVKFLVNGQARHTDALPTATDKSGNIVNWFEVGAKDVDAELEAGEIERHQIINHIRRSTPSIMKNPQGNQSGSTLADESRFQSGYSTPAQQELVVPSYTQEIPQSFQTFSGSTDDLLPLDEEFIHKHPIPELPVYLNNNYLNKHFSTHHTLSSDTAIVSNKSNASGPQAQNSLMQGLNSHIIPHVNLNHLLTSNIKNGVLGVACTMRYSGKFVTQIMYSPSEPEGQM